MLERDISVGSVSVCLPVCPFVCPSYAGVASKLMNPLSFFLVFLPAGLRVAQPCRYCFYSLAQKWVFRPAGATRCPDKRKSWHGERTSQLSRLSGQKCGNTAPKTVKISNFGQKFVPQGRLVCDIITKFSAFVRVYR